VLRSDRTVTEGPYPGTKAVLGGFTVVDVPSRGEAGSPSRASVRRRYAKILDDPAG
jgi:hypothetical protein